MHRERKGGWAVIDQLPSVMCPWQPYDAQDHTKPIEPLWPGGNNFFLISSEKFIVFLLVPAISVSSF